MLHVIQSRFVFYAISGFLFLFSLFSLAFFNLNLWIDMTGGTQNEFSYGTYDFDIDEITTEANTIKWHINLSGSIINTIDVYKITGENAFVVEAGFSQGIETKLLEEFKVGYRTQLEAAYAEKGDIELSRYTNIGASFGDYIRKTAIITLVIAIGGITIYLAYAFSGAVAGISSLSFAAITIVTLFHDVFISTGLYILTSSFFPEYKVDTLFVTALLTILGYSINDTIVIFDRIRSNLMQYAGKWKKLEVIIDDSVNETMTRSIYTSATIVFVLFCIFFFWPESISGFTLVLIFGTIVGTFSSIFIASPLLYDINKNKELKQYVKKEINPDDKIVV